MLVQFRTDRIFHHVLGNVAQIQLVLGLRRLEAQLWQGNESFRLLRLKLL